MCYRATPCCSAVVAVAVLGVTAFARPLSSNMESPLVELRSTESHSKDKQDHYARVRRHQEELPHNQHSGNGGGFAVDQRKAVRDEARRWPDAIIPYHIQPSAGNISSAARSLIRSAMDYWENNTCLRFVLYNPKADKDYIIIQKGSWCSSVAGRRGGPQPLNLALGCLKFGSIVHELGHASGWVHEHARPDRDSYIEILWNKVKNEDDKKQLSKFDNNTVNTYGIPYDYQSIMHYNGTSGTIRALDQKQQKLMGQRERLSFYDVKLSNIMYKCAERNHCNLTAEACEAEGYVGPKCTCVCPDGTDSCAAKKTTGAAERCDEWTVHQSFRKSGQSGTGVLAVDGEICKELCRNETKFVCVSADYHSGEGVCYLNSASEPNATGALPVMHYARNLKCSGAGKNEAKKRR